MGENMRQELEHNDKFKTEVQLQRKDGSIITVETSIAAIDSESEGQTRFVGLIRDITERNQMITELRRNLKEKEMMLGEIHHRVKNNLAIISALLQLQAMYAKDPAVKEELNRSLQRIHTIANIHEDFYESEELTQVKFSNFLDRWQQALTRQLEAQSKAMNIVIDSSNLELNINQAVPTALLLNELSSHIIECMKNQQQNLRTLLRIRRQQDQVHFELDFTGTWEQGQEILLSEEDQLSNELIEALLYQLEAEKKAQSNQKLHIQFPIKNIQGSAGHRFFS